MRLTSDTKSDKNSELFVGLSEKQIVILMQLHVRVVEATDVPKMDFFGKADPYCLLQLSSSSTVRKTKVCESTYSPVWNDEFHFPVTNQATDSLHILMKDRDRGCADDPISQISIPLATLAQGNVIDKWYDMQPVRGVKKGGRLRLVLHLANTGMTPFQQMQMMPPPMMGRIYQPQVQMYPPQMIRPPPQAPMMAPQMIGCYPPPAYGQQPMMGGYQQQPMIGGYQQPAYGQPQMINGYLPPMMGGYPPPPPAYGQPPMMGGPVIGHFQQHPMMGHPMMGGMMGRR